MTPQQIFENGNKHMATKFRFIGKSSQLVIKYIITKMRKYSSFFESNTTIATNVGCSLRTVQNAIKRAEQLGIFSVESRFEPTLDGKKRQTTNVINLLAFAPFEMVEGIFKVARTVRKAVKLVEIAKQRIKAKKPIRTEIIPAFMDESFVAPAPADNITKSSIMDKLKQFRER